MNSYYCIVKNQLDLNMRCYEVTTESDAKAIVHFKRIFGDRLRQIYIDTDTEGEDHIIFEQHT